MAKAPFPVDPVLTGIVLAYRNRRYIADQVLPRLDPMTKEEFKYTLWNLAEGFRLQDTKVGRKSQPNEVEFSAEEKTGTTVDHGLDDVIPNTDFDNAAGSVDPEARAAEGLAEYVALGREKRVADTVFAAATYPAANKVQLTGTDRWSDFTNSDPIEDIQAGLDTPILRPNIMVIGRPGYSVLIRNPKILKATNRNDGDTGIARRQDIADLFELDEILVGEPFVNAAKKGQAASLSRLWGKHCALLHRNLQATTPMSNQVTFGWTAQYGERVSGSIPEPKVGLRGSVRVRVGESVAEVIAAADVGYFIEDIAA